VALKNLRAEGKSIPEIANAIGRTPASTEKKVWKLQLPAAKKAEAGRTLQEDREVLDESHWKRQHADLARKYAAALKEQNLVDRLVSEIKNIAPVGYSPAPKLVPNRTRSRGKPQSAVLEFSDTHIGKEVQPSQTLNFGSYNFPTFLARLKYLEESIISIVHNHINTPVPELVIAMLGDMLDGALKHSNECGQVNPLFNQFFAGGHAIAQFIRNLAPHFPLLRIYEVVGNHPRFADQKKMPTENKHSNFDKFLYAYIQALVRDLPNVEWDLSSQPYQVFDVNGFGFFAGHGETLRGGDKTLGIPNHAVGRAVSTTAQLFGKYGKVAPNYYLYGHLHRNISLPHATGDVIINGGFVGVDGFGLSEMFTPADPMQKLFFVHGVYGKTATYDINLKFAQIPEKEPYEIPGGFRIC
jgi:hypothetical protein